MRLNALGALLGAVAGFGLVFLLEWRDTTLKSDDDVRIATDLPVLAYVPLLSTRRERGRAQRRRWFVGVTAVALLAVAAAAALWILKA